MFTIKSGLCFVWWITNSFKNMTRISLYLDNSKYFKERPDQNVYRHSYNPNLHGMTFLNNKLLAIALLKYIYVCIRIVNYNSNNFFLGNVMILLAIQSVILLFFVKFKRLKRSVALRKLKNNKQKG